MKLFVFCILLLQILVSLALAKENCREIGPTIGVSDDSFEKQSYLAYLQNSDIDFQDQHMSIVEYKQVSIGLQYILFGRFITNSFPDSLELTSQPFQITVTYAKTSQDQQFGCIQSMYFEDVDQDLVEIGNTDFNNMYDLDIQSFEFDDMDPVFGLYGMSDDTCIRQLGFITCQNVTNSDTEIDQNESQIDLNDIKDPVDEEEDSLNPAAILVPLFLLVLIAIIGAFFLRKFRKKMPKEGQDGNKKDIREQEMEDLKNVKKDGQINNKQTQFKRQPAERSSVQGLMKQDMEEETPAKMITGSTQLQGSEHKPINSENADGEAEANLDMQQYQEFTYSFKPTPGSTQHINQADAFKDFHSTPTQKNHDIVDPGQIQMQVMENPYEVKDQAQVQQYQPVDPTQNQELKKDGEEQLPPLPAKFSYSYADQDQQQQ